MITSSIDEIKKLAQSANREEFCVLEDALAGDTRKGVVNALKAAKRRLDAEEAEELRLSAMYSFEREIAVQAYKNFACNCKKSCDNLIILGLDEVGRGPIAGPLAVGAIVLNSQVGEQDKIAGLNDSKKVKANLRDKIAAEIKGKALFWHVEFTAANIIDGIGISAALKRAFRASILKCEEAGITPDIILLDGNPLHIDKREINVIKGDGKCASIAAASIVAKVARDKLMDNLALEYPMYGFESNKGYGTQAHRDAITIHGLSNVHRKSFCMEFLQESLF